MVRRTFPELIAHDIVGVQPMTGPVGLAFALRYRAGGDRTYTPQTKPLGSEDWQYSDELGYNAIDPWYSGDNTHQIVHNITGELLVQLTVNLQLMV